LGPVVDVIMGWDQLNKDQVNVDSFSKIPSVELGQLVKVMRKWPITEKLLLEPEIHFGASQETQRYFLE